MKSKRQDRLCFRCGYRRVSADLPAVAVICEFCISAAVRSSPPPSQRKQPPLPLLAVRRMQRAREVSEEMRGKRRAQEPLPGEPDQATGRARGPIAPPTEEREL